MQENSIYRAYILLHNQLDTFAVKTAWYNKKTCIKLEVLADLHTARAVYIFGLATDLTKMYIESNNTSV